MGDVKAVVFDFDGVILQSVDIKTRAFEALFSPEGSGATKRILAHHLANGGVSRFEKFRWAYREVLRRPLSGEEERSLGERYNRLVEDAVMRAEWVPGAHEFLETHHGRLPLYVVSGTPQDELRRIVERRGMSRYFKGVHGTPPGKTELLGRLVRDVGLPAASVAMVGDALTDHAAARAVGTGFVAVLGSGLGNEFPKGTVELPDLRSLAETLRLGANGSA